ncbi:hypothetical protein I3W98_09530, partial [Streptomyces cavourensis]|nr:hypothetical protein [Streptomyces cavourensis]
MDLQLSDDQRALRSGMRDLLGAVFDREALRAAVERGGAVDRGLWRELATFARADAGLLFERRDD